MRPTSSSGTPAAPGASAAGDDWPRLSAEAVAETVAGLGLAPFEWDPRRDRFRWSPAVAEVLGVDPAAVPASARALQRLITPSTQAARAAAVPTFDPAGPLPEGYTVTWRIARADGGEVELEETGTFVPTADGILVRGALRRRSGETTGRRGGAAAEAAHGLLDRERLLDRLSQVVAGLSRDREGSAAFVMFAVDGLARINAGFGYDVGDAVIGTVARRIAGRMRQRDVLGHMAGHRFGAVLHDCTESMLSFAVERFLAAIAEEVMDAGAATVAATVSIGAVVVPRNAPDGPTAALRAEEALAEARAAGGNRAVVYAPSPDRDRRRRQNRRIAEEIAAGLAEDRFLLAYQPIVSAADGTLLHHEALSRLVRTDGTVAPAGDLFGTAERLGLVGRIDMRALQLALADLAADPALHLSVNVSAATALGGSWLQRVVEAVAENRRIAGRLTVEVTETAAVADAEHFARFAGTLRDIGCALSIDDFGCGHTSIRTLRDLAVDWVKIDGSFVRDIARDPDALAFVRALLGIAAHLGVRTVAEWVEDGATAAILRDLGVTALQGHHVGRPLLRVPPGVAAPAGVEAFAASGDGRVAAA